jgi:hypothetical protein
MTLTTAMSSLLLRGIRAIEIHCRATTASGPKTEAGRIVAAIIRR